MRSADLLSHPASGSRRAGQGRRLINTDFFGDDRRELNVGQNKEKNSTQPVTATNATDLTAVGTTVASSSSSVVLRNADALNAQPFKKRRQLVAGHLTSQVTC